MSLGMGAERGREGGEWPFRFVLPSAVRRSGPETGSRLPEDAQSLQLEPETEGGDGRKV